MRASLLVVVLATSAACGVTTFETPTGELDSTHGAITSTLTSSATVSFRDDWSVTTSAALAVGGEVRIEYDVRRVGRCTGTLNGGEPAWTTTAHVRLAGGHEKLLIVGGHSPSSPAPAVVALDHAGTLELWFETTNRWGCQEWDSNFGRNYRFDVFTPTLVHFNRDFSTTVEGSLRGARAIALDYPLERLPNCRQTYAGLPSWEILSYARFDDALLFQTTVTRFNGSSRVASLGVYEVPAGARTVEVWFLNSDRGGCAEWDSAYGRNYRFSLE